MTYEELKQANANGVAKYNGADHGKKPSFKFRIADVDLKRDLCLINGEWQSISSVVVAILKNHICVTNISALRSWSKFTGTFKYYADDELTHGNNTVIFATPRFYTNEGKMAIVQQILTQSVNNVPDVDIVDEYDHDAILNAYLSNMYDTLCNRLMTAQEHRVLLLMRRKDVKTQRAGNYVLKELKPAKSWDCILGCFGTKDYAYYVDAKDLRFKGYAGVDESVIYEGILREIPVNVTITSDISCELLQALEQGNTRAVTDLLNKYTKSLKPYFMHVKNNVN